MTIAIIIVVVVVLGIIVSIASPLLAASTGSKVGSAFDRAYAAEFGAAPPASASRAVANGVGIISAFVARSKKEQELGRERLANAVSEYGDAVGWNESKMEVGLLCMSAVCFTQNGTVAPGYGWAVEVLENAFVRYCPSAMRCAWCYPSGRRKRLRRASRL